MADPWLEQVAADLAVSSELPVDALLETARVVAHSVERKATPLTTYLIGVATQNGGDTEALCERVRDLARAWESSG